MPNKPLSKFRLFCSGAAAALVLTLAGGAQAQGYVNATVGGQLAPGVYGRINIGNAAPPPVIYAEPMIAQRPTVVLPRAPIYLYVPPGHARDWRRHCAHYGACNQPVYFVQEPPPRRGPPPQHYRNGRDDRRWDNDHRHGNRHDRGHDRDRDHGRRDHGRDHGPRH